MYIKSHFRRGLSFISNARCLYCYCMDPKTQKIIVCVNLMGDFLLPLAFSNYAGCIIRVS